MEIDTSIETDVNLEDALYQVNKFSLEAEFILENSIKEGLISSENIWDRHYIQIPNTDPQKYKTQFTDFFKNYIQPIEDKYLSLSPNIGFVLLTDNNGYVASHNSIYDKTLTGNYSKDVIGNRSMRIFNDSVGLAAARNKEGFIIQFYARDTGEIMTDISVPVFIEGRHWGAARIGLYKKLSLNGPSDTAQYLAAKNTITNKTIRLKQLSDFNSLLSHATEVVARADSDEGVMQSICNLAVEYAQAMLVWVGRFNSQNKLEVLASAGESNYLNEVFNLDNLDLKENQCVLLKVWKNKSYKYTSFYNHDGVKKLWKEKAAKFGFGSLACLPIFRNNEIWAVFNVYFKDEEIFDKNLQKILENLSRNIGYGLDKIDLNKKTKSINDFNEALIASMTPGMIVVRYPHLVPEKGITERVNQRMLELFGASSEDEIVNKNTRVLYPDDATYLKVREFIKEVLLGKKHTMRDIPYRRLDNGKIIYIDLSGKTFSVSESDLCVWTFVDVTEQHNLTQKLMEQTKEAQDYAQLIKESQMRYHELIESLPIGIFVHDGNKILFTNKAISDLYGASNEELKGQPVINFVPQKSREDFAKRCFKLIKGATVPSVQEEFQRNDGSKFYGEVQSVLIEYDGNLAIQETIQDISERKAMEEKINQERKQFEDILNSIDDIVVLPSNNIPIFINQKFYKIMPFNSFEEFISKHNCVCDLFIKREGYLQKMMGNETWLAYIVKHSDLTHKVIMVNRNNEERVYRITGGSAKFGEKDVVVITFSDITDIEEAKKIAEETAKIKGDFMANMSHEIRTPMNAISGFVKLLEQTPVNEKQRRYIDIISSSSKHLIGIINDILDFSKIESGKMELDNVKWNPYIEIDKITSLYISKMNEKEIVFESYLDSIIPECLEIDSLRLTQIIGNLLSNAVKFTPKKGKIIFYANILGSNNNKSMIRFGVKDNGVGIPKEKQETIFQAFSQADSSITRQFGGTGLGLTISARLVSLMGGNLKVYSEIGKGSDFYFDLPINNCQENHFISSIFNNLNVIIKDSPKNWYDEELLLDYFNKWHIPYRRTKENIKLLQEQDCSYIMFYDEV